MQNKKEVQSHVKLIAEAALTKRTYVVLLLATLILLILPGPRTAAAYTPRSTILIEDNTDFTGTNGIVGGSGTEVDPFVIEGWEINASAADGIVIRNTTLPFVVRDVLVHSGGSTFVGIRLENVVNGRLTNSTVTGNKEGVIVDGSIRVELVGNRILNHLSGPGISSYLATDLEIRGNNVSANAHYGIYVHSAVNLTVMDNEVHDNAFDGIDIVSGTTVTIANNTVTGSGAFGINVGWTPGVIVSGNHPQWNTGAGIYVLSSPGAWVRDNIVTGNQPVNIRVQSSDDAALLRNNVSRSTTGISISTSIRGDLRNNTVHVNGRGLDLQTVTNTTVTGNVFLNNTVYGASLFSSSGNRIHHNWFTNSGANDDPAGPNAWDDGYPSGGNWWTPYGGRDQCHGPAQDNCTASDGIGDTSRYIYGDAEDQYPLVPYFPNSAPVASFTISPATGVAGTTFFFDPSSSHDGEDSVSELYIWWDFESDGRSDGEGHADSVYPRLLTVPGTYSVRLRVEDTDGRTAFATRTLVVLEGPTPPGPTNPPTQPFLSGLQILALLLVLAIVVGSAMFAVTRRQRLGRGSAGDGGEPPPIEDESSPTDLPPPPDR